MELIFIHIFTMTVVLFGHFATETSYIVVKSDI